MSAPGLGTKSCPLARQHSVEQWFSTGWFCFPRQHLKTHQAVTSKGDCAIRVALLETWDVLIILKVHRAAPTTKNFPTHVSSAEDEKPYFREKKKSRVPREDRAKETVAEDAAGERCWGHVTHRLLFSVRTFVFFKASGKTLNSLQHRIIVIRFP